jgi:plastocyanin
MRRSKLIRAAGVTPVAVAVLLGAGAAGANAAVPSKVVVKEKYSVKMTPNRYIQDGMRFDRDVYRVKSGGTVQFKMTAPQEGPHTFTVVARKDLPKNAKQTFNCVICNKLAIAHGADPNSEAPPKFLFLENGVGQNTAPKLDRPGDSAFLAPQKGAAVNFKVTARKGATLRFMCLVHPWMQATLEVR